MKSLAHHLKQSEHQKEYYHLATKGAPVPIDFLLSNSHLPIILQLTEKLSICLTQYICSNYGSYQPTGVQHRTAIISSRQDPEYEPLSLLGHYYTHQMTHSRYICSYLLLRCSTKEGDSYNLAVNLTLEGLLHRYVTYNCQDFI